MPDQPRKPPADDDYEVVDPPPAERPPGKLPLARAVGRRPEPVDDDEDFEEVPRPRRPVAGSFWRAHRRLLVLLGAFWGLMAVLAVAAVVLQVVGGGKPVVNWNQDGTPPLPRPAAVKAAPAGWQEFTDHLGAYTVWVPVGATATSVDTSRVPVPAGAAPPRGVQWLHAGRQYVLTVGPAPAADRTPGKPPEVEPSNDTLTRFLNSVRSSLGLRTDPFGRFGGGVEYVMVGGHRGAAASDAPAGGRSAHLQGTVFGGAGYVLVVTDPAGAPASDPAVAPFFAGFQLTPGAAPPPGATAPPVVTSPPAQGATNAPGPTRPPRPAPAQPQMPPEKPADLGPPPALPPLPADWAEFPDPQGAFTARLPAGLTPAPQTVQEWGATTVKPRGWVWEQGGLKYHLLVVEEWPQPRPNAPPKTDAQADRANRSHLGWLQSYVRWATPYRPAGPPRPVWLAGKRAAADTRTAADGKTVLHLRGLVADGAGYYLAVVGPADLADTAPEVAAFFDGFQITAAAAPPADPKKPGRTKKG